MGQVDGKIALVTGGASGIGAACAETLAREGASVVVSDIDDGSALIGQITAAGGSFCKIQSCTRPCVPKFGFYLLNRSMEIGNCQPAYEHGPIQF